MKRDVFWVNLATCLFAACLLGAIAVALSGCATANTTAAIRTVDADGSSEDVTFKSQGVVTWGSKQELQEGALDYAWGPDSHFTAGGSAVGQQAYDPMTALMSSLLQTLIDRMFPVPVVTPEPLTLEVTP